MEKDGNGDGLHHHAIRVLPPAPEVAVEEEITSESDCSLHQKAAEIMASSMAAYRCRPLSFWVLLVLSGGAMLTAFPASSLLSRLYYNNGGQSKWILSWSAVAGWPLPALLLLPYYLLGKASPKRPSPRLCSWYVLFGLLSAADNLMYAWAYAYLPASTASLVAASSLVFSAVFGRLIVKNRLHLSSLNAIFVITAGVVIVALDSRSDRYPGITGGQYALGFALDVLGSALHGLIFALSEARSSSSPTSSAGAPSTSYWRSRQRCRSARSRSRPPGSPCSGKGSRRCGGIPGGRRGGVRDGGGVVGGDVPGRGARGHRRAVPGVDGACWRAERYEGAIDERRGGDLVP